MLRLTCLFTLPIVLMACEERHQGTGDCLLRIRGVEEQGHLFVDTVDRGPIREDQIFAQLAAGTHVVELRRGTTVAFHSVMNLPAQSELVLRIDVPVPVAPIARVPQNSAPCPAPQELAALVVAPPSAATMPTSVEPLVAPRSAPERAPRRSRDSVRSSESPRASPSDATSHPTETEDSRTWIRQVMGDSEPPETRPRAQPTRQLPNQPSREETSRVMARIQGPIAACGNGQQGTAMVRLRVMGATGGISEVVVTGRFAGTPVATCIERIARTASFAPFGNNFIFINYPFRI